MARPCPLIARALERYADDVEVDEYLPGDEDPDVDCVINVRPLPGRPGHGDKFASLYFSYGKLHDGDVQVSERQLSRVKEVLRTTAKSCRSEGVHEHGGHGDAYWPAAAAYHVHIAGCSIPDLGKVLRAGGY